MLVIYSMVSEIHDNADLALGVENVIELEGEISMRELNFKLLNKALPILCVQKELIKSKERRYSNV